MEVLSLFCKNIFLCSIGSSGFGRTDYLLYKKLKTESFLSPDQKMIPPKRFVAFSCYDCIESLVLRFSWKTNFPLFHISNVYLKFGSCRFTDVTTRFILRIYYVLQLCCLDIKYLFGETSHDPTKQKFFGH